MASKDEYYQKVIATLQSDIKGVQQDLQKLSKRLEALESMSSIHKTESNPSFNHKQFMAELKEWANKHNNAIRDLVVNMFVISWNKAYSDITTKSQFTQYQEEMKLKLIDIEERITTTEKNAGHRISLFTLSRPTYVTEHYNGPDRHPIHKASFLSKYIKEISLFIGVIIFTLSICLLAIINEKDTLQRDNTSLRNALEQLYKSEHNHSSFNQTSNQ